MELKPGYKQTEVGVLPDEWEVDSVVNLAAITTGDKNTQDRVEDGAYPFFVRSQTIERINSYTFDGEAVLTAGDGVGTGKIFHYINGKFDIHQRVYKISQFGERLNGYFFYLYFSNNFYSRIMQMTAKSSVDSVRREMIADMKMPVPSFEEQCVIAAALSDVDALLAKQDQLIAKKRDLKQAAMQQLLIGQTRLPGFSGEWEVKRLGDVLHVRHGKSQHHIATSDGQYPILATGGEIGRTNTFLYNKPSVLIGRKGTIDKPQYRDEPFWTVDTLFYTEILDGASAKFIFYKFNMINWRSYNEASGVPSLNASTIENIEIKLPMPGEQTAIATVLSDMDADIAVLEARRDKTRALKQGMMQNLLTGAIRLVDTGVKTIDQPALAVMPNTPVLAESEPSHNWAFNEAVVISVLAHQFGKPDFPLGRLRYTKLSYLMHRKAENDAEGYLKKAAGPYNPKTKYAGPEKIAQQNGYVRQHANGKFKGLVAAEKVDLAQAYFDRWYGTELVDWLEQFRYKTNDELERLATVDMAMKELRGQGKPVDLAAVRSLIESEPEWAPKLARSIFSDDGITVAMAQCRALFQ